MRGMCTGVSGDKVRHDVTDAMLLYHGTKESSLAGILVDGIRPRSPDSEGNHAGTVPELKSREGMVYLSSSGSVQYAEMAAGSGRYLILEIDSNRLKESDMLPDEDTIVHEALYLERVAPGPDYLNRYKEMLPRVDQFEHQERWKELLEGGGTVAHHGIIPPGAITRYALIEPSLAPRFLEIHSTLAFLASARKGMRHRFLALPAYIFDGNVEPLFQGNDLEQIGPRLNELRAEWLCAFQITRR